MSLECSECERDMRGGHDEGCSRHRYCACGHGQAAHDSEEGDCRKRECLCRQYRPLASLAPEEGGTT